MGARDESSAQHLYGAPEWGAKLIENGWTNAGLDTFAPFYFVRGEAPEDESSLDSYGVLAGPLPTFRAAARTKQRFESLPVPISVTSAEDYEIAICDRCGKEIVPHRAGQIEGLSGLKYRCGACMSQGTCPGIGDGDE